MDAAPVRELQAMLEALAPELHEHPYRFVPHGPEDDFIDLLGRMFAFVREAEGVTLVVRTREDHPGPLFGGITLGVHSDLEGVGLTAAIATALTSKGIACNVIAGFHHDHVFVPWGRRFDALETISTLSDDAAGRPQS